MSKCYLQMGGLRTCRKIGVIQMTELTTLKNIGEMMDEKLKSVGISTAEQLKEIGSKEAFTRLKKKYPNDKAMSLVHLYVLEGAITDTEYNQLPENVKASLKYHSDSLKIFGL